MSKAARQQRYRAKLRAESRCQWCGKPLDCDSVKYCYLHLKRSKIQQEKRRYNQAQRGTDR